MKPQDAIRSARLIDAKEMARLLVESIDDGEQQYDEVAFDMELSQRIGGRSQGFSESTINLPRDFAKRWMETLQSMVDEELARMGVKP